MNTMNTQAVKTVNLNVVISKDLTNGTYLVTKVKSWKDREVLATNILTFDDALSIAHTA